MLLHIFVLILAAGSPWHRKASAVCADARVRDVVRRGKPELSTAQDPGYPLRERCQASQPCLQGQGRVQGRQGSSEHAETPSGVS